MPYNANAIPRAAVWTLKSSNPDLPAESAILPDDGSNATESVFEEDKRRLVNPQDFADGGKYRSIVKIQALFNAGNGRSVWMMGSGWLISPDTVVTAGHVVYDWSRRLQGAIEIKCYIGYSGLASVGTSNVQARFGERIITTAEWIEAAGNRTHDVAFIKVNRPFTGNLRNIAFKDTPSVAKSVLLGVVGYPGDKYLKTTSGTDEKGAQMYEEFAPTDFNIEKSERHMVEYQISTFAGQSGAPILQAIDNGLISIGTHCYGGGGDYSNSGNSIGGQYGVHYNAFLALFNSHQFPAAQRLGIKVLDVDTNARAHNDVRNGNGQIKSDISKYVNGNSNGNGVSNNEYNGFRAENTSFRPSQTDNFGTGNSNGSGEEGFLDILKSVARVAAPVVSTVTPFLGPIGGPIGSIAGGILSTIGGAESAIINGDVSSAIATSAASGATERAVLAEASLQALLKLEDSPETAELLHTIDSKYRAFRPKLDVIAKVAQPQLTECGLMLAHREMARIHERGVNQGQESEIELPREELKGVQESILYSQSGQETAFVKGLLAPTRPVPGEESFFSDLGSVLSKGVSFAKPLISSAAQGALKSVIGKLSAGTESELSSSTPGSHEHATLLAFKRAAAAEAALQTLMTLPQQKLDRLLISSPRGGEESFFDVIKSGVQKIAPAALDIAKQAVRKVVPIIADAVSQKVKDAVGESAPGIQYYNYTLNPLKAVKSKQSVGDLLALDAGAYNSAKVSSPLHESEATNDDDDAPKPTLNDILSSRQSTWVPSLHRRKSWDSNDDGLCSMDEECL